MIAVSPVIRLISKIASIILYAMTLFSAYGGWFDPHIFTLPAIMTLPFPYLAILTFLVAVSWLAGRRLIIGATGIAVLIAAWTPLSMVFPMNTEKKAEPGEKTFTILAWNCLHLQDQKAERTPSDEAMDFLLHSGADIICLIELWKDDFDAPGDYFKNVKEKMDSLDRLYPYRIVGQVCDQTIWSKYPVEILDRPIGQTDFNHDYGFYRFNIDGQELTVLGLHMVSFRLSEEERKVITDIKKSSALKNSIREFKGPIKGKMQFANAERADEAHILCDALSDIRGPVIICGDFNDVPASWTYRTFLQHGFRDAYTETNFGLTYTYNAHMMLFHLDQMMYRGNLRPLKVKRGNISTSDHYPLTGTFSFTK